MIKLRKKQKGFTLVELLIVIAIIAVLAAVVTPVAMGAIASSKATAIVSEVNSIQTADLAYYVSEGENATDIDDLVNFIDVSKSENATYSIDVDDITNVRTLNIEVNEDKVLTALTGKLSTTSSSDLVLGTPTIKQ